MGCQTGTVPVQAATLLASGSSYTCMNIVCLPNSQSAAGGRGLFEQSKRVLHAYGVLLFHVAVLINADHVSCNATELSRLVCVSHSQFRSHDCCRQAGYICAPGAGHGHGQQTSYFTLIQKLGVCLKWVFWGQNHFLKTQVFRRFQPQKLHLKTLEKSVQAKITQI